MRLAGATLGVARVGGGMLFRELKHRYLKFALPFIVLIVGGLNDVLFFSLLILLLCVFIVFPPIFSIFVF